MILGIVCVFTGIALVDLPAIWHHQKRRELIVYLMIFIPALVLAILIAMGVKIPSALDALANLFESIFGKIYTQ